MRSARKKEGAYERGLFFLGLTSSHVSLLGAQRGLGHGVTTLKDAQVAVLAACAVLKAFKVQRSEEESPV